jgi:hypothetical protein
MGRFANHLAGGGVMCINWGENIARIQDGSSNTVMLGELRTGSHLSTLDPRGTWAMGFPGASVLAWDILAGITRYRTPVKKILTTAKDVSMTPKAAWEPWPGCPYLGKPKPAADTHGRGERGHGRCRAFASFAIQSSQAAWWYMNSANDGRHHTSVI